MRFRLFLMMLLQIAIWGAWANRFLAASHLLSGLCLIGAAFSATFWPFFLCYLTYSPFYVPTQSVANTVALVAAAISFTMALYSLTLPRTQPRLDAADKLAWRAALRQFRKPALLVLLGVGNVVASFPFSELTAHLTYQAGGRSVVDYQTLFLVPTGLAVLGSIILALFFHPGSRAPVRPDTLEDPLVSFDPGAAPIGGRLTVRGRG